MTQNSDGFNLNDPESIWRVIIHERRDYLLLFALRHLGRCANADDAEEALQEFCLRSLEKIIQSYDPSKGKTFWGYFLECFSRFCWDVGARIRSKHAVTFSINEPREKDQSESPVYEVADKSPESNVEQSAVNKEVSTRLWECINELPERYREVIVHHYIEGMTEAEIAKHLGITKANVKMRLYRGRKLIAFSLIKRNMDQ